MNGAYVPLLTLLLITKEKKPTERPTAVVSIFIDAPVESVFDYIVPIDLSHIFRRYKNLPAIDSTSNQERWYTPGMERTVYFEDGSTAHEHLVSVNPSTDFSYQINGFTSFLGKLAEQINGKWVFTETQPGQTHIEWTYELEPKNFLAGFIIRTFVLKNLKGLLNNALAIIKADLEMTESR